MSEESSADESGDMTVHRPNWRSQSKPHHHSVFSVS